MPMTPSSAAAVLLLRSLADRIENGELEVASLTTGSLVDESRNLNNSDPYNTVLVRSRLEVLTFKAPLFNQES